MTVTVLRLSVVCPACGAPPRLRTPPSAQQLLAGGPEDVVLTYQCHRERPDGTLCNALYEIRVKHFRTAAA